MMRGRLLLSILAAGVVAVAFFPAAPAVERFVAGRVGQYVSCTAFPIHATDGYWITAGHCIAGEELWIGQDRAELVTVDHAVDVAVLRGPKKRAFKLALTAPKVGDATVAIGHPGGIDLALPFYGRIQHVRVIFPFYRPEPIQITHEGGGKGMSGAPVLVKGRVVGVVIGGYDFPSVVMFSVPWADLARVTRGYWG